MQTLRANNGGSRVAYVPGKYGQLPFEAYFPGINPPCGACEDVRPFATLTEAIAWLSVKGARFNVCTILNG